MKDKQGRAYAKVTDVKAGDTVQVDGDFICLNEGAQHTVFKNVKGELYIKCLQGDHLLDGQIEGDGENAYYVGVYPL